MYVFLTLRSPNMSRLLLLILSLTSFQISMGLKCWSSSLSLSYRPDTYEEMSCSTASKSCKKTEYYVAGMKHTKAECSTEDKKTCSDVKKGKVLETTCFCKSDYCNSGLRHGGFGVMSLILGVCALKAFAT